MKIAILGAGIAGLELGRLLHQMGKDFIILEKENEIGGLARTNKTGNYLWDFGVHAMYSKNKEIFDYYYSLPLNYQHSDRGVKIYHTGKNKKSYLVDYPFEEGVKDLPLMDRWDCVRGYLESYAKNRDHFVNLKDWIDNRLGYGIAKHFMIPYNNKIWSCDLTDISMGLVSKKIHPASVKNFVLGALGKKVVGRLYQAKFIYPQKGVQALMDYTAKDIRDRIFLNRGVDALIREGGRWTIIDTHGERLTVDTIVSTIPLVELLKKVNIEGLKKHYDPLKWNNTHFVMVGLKEGRDFQLMRDCHWAFFKESEIFYRITLMHNFSSSFLPTLIAEITHKGNVLNMSPEEIKQRTVEDLLRLKIVKSREDVAAVDIKLVPYTYPIPTVGLEAVKEELTARFEKHDILLLGRNGHWDYVNMDGVIGNVRKFVAEKFAKESRVEALEQRS